MKGTAGCYLFCFSLICFACTNNTSKPRTDSFSYEKVNILIECPNNYSYYFIDFSSKGEGTLAFCFDRVDASDLKVGRTDSLNEITTFHISNDDLRKLDTLVLSLPVLIDSTARPYDTYKYIVKVDGKSKFEASDSVEHVYKMLKLLTPYFPKDKRTYDFYEFFTLFETIKI